MFALLSRAEVPLDVRERFILGSYRPAHCSPFKCLVSAFTLHNETFNIWTHVLPLLYFLYAMTSCGVEWGWVAFRPAGGGAHMPACPWYGYLAGVIFLFASSSFAHLFNCHSLRSRHLCFMLDYAAISVYGVTSAVAYHNYIYRTPYLGPLGALEEREFLVVTVTCAVVAMAACCWTRLNPSPLCHVIRTGAFCLPFVAGSLPAFLRCKDDILSFYRSNDTVQCRLNSLFRSTYPDWFPGEPGTGLVPGGQTAIINHTDCVSSESLSFTTQYAMHVIFLVLAAAFNVSRVPERWWPGSFDLVGHSHQWFHVFVYLGLRSQFWLLLGEITAASTTPELAADTSFLGQATISDGTALITFSTHLASLVAIGVWFDSAVHANLAAESQTAETSLTHSKDPLANGDNDAHIPKYIPNSR